GDQPRRRDLLIEHLHLIQDRYHRLHVDHLAALAEEMRLALAEVYEVATFYAHFDVVDHGEAGPPPLTVRGCDSLTCGLFGAESLLSDLATRLGPDVRVVRAPCVGGCDRAPAAVVGQRAVEPANVDAVAQTVREGTLTPIIPKSIAFDEYVAAGGY